MSSSNLFVISPKKVAHVLTDDATYLCNGARPDPDLEKVCFVPASIDFCKRCMNVRLRSIVDISKKPRESEKQFKQRLKRRKVLV